MGTVAAPLLAGFAFAAIGVVIGAQDQLRWPDQALVLIVCSLLLFVTSLQATFNARRHYVPPAEWSELLRLAPNAARRSELQLNYRSGLDTYKKWSGIARTTYNLAIMALFASTAVVLVPKGDLSAWRAVAIGVAALGGVIEVTWTAIGELSRRRRRMKVHYGDRPGVGDVRGPRVGHRIRG